MSVGKWQVPFQVQVGKCKKSLPRLLVNVCAFVKIACSTFTLMFQTKKYERAEHLTIQRRTAHLEDVLEGGASVPDQRASVPEGQTVDCVRHELVEAQRRAIDLGPLYALLLGTRRLQKTQKASV